MTKEMFSQKVSLFLARTISALPDGAHNTLSKMMRNPQFSDLDPGLKTLLGLRRLFGADESVGSPEQVRADFRKHMLRLIIKTTPVHFVEELIFMGAEAPLQARRYVPKAIDKDHPLPLLVYYHGGSFSVGDLDTHDEACRLLCKHGNMQVLSVTYRLSPEHPFPAAYHDAIVAFKWAHSQIQAWDVIPEMITVGGDSAGGSLAAAVSSALADTPYAPNAQLLIYPGIDFHLPTLSKYQYRQGLTLTYTDLMYAYKQYNPEGNHAHDDPRLALLNSRNLEKMPPTFVATAGLDILRDEGEIYAKRLSGLGVYTVLKRMIRLPHGFINVTSINASAKRATIQIAHDYQLMLAQIYSRPLPGKPLLGPAQIKPTMLAQPA